MNFSADRLLDFIATSASAGTEFEATYTFSKMTMEVIGNTAFGVDFHLQTSLADTPPPSIPLPSSSSSSSSPSSPNSASRRCGFDLLSAARSLFQPLNLRGNKARIVLGLAPLLSWVQRRGVAIGGRVKALKNISLARCFIWGILQGILENNIGLDSIESIGLKSNTPETTLSSAGASTTGDMTTRKQCPMHALGKVRAKSFAKGKNSLSTLVPDTPLLFKLLRGAVNPQTEKPFTEFDICAQGFNVIIGAYETTALGMSYTLYELSKKPALQRRIAQEVAALRALKKQEEFASPSKQTRASDSTSLPFDITFDDLQHLPFTEACFLEALRLWPPVSPLVPMSRHAKEEVYLDGHKIPKGACVMFNVWHIHHNPKYFPNPEEYAPERFLPNHPELKTRHKQAFLPFGAGPRKCIGKAFSVAEAVISLARMLEQFEFRLDMTRSAELNTITTGTMQPTNGVWLKVFKRRVEEQS
jgi:cytochrome P450